jgi:hypothetical protein
MTGLPGGRVSASSGGAAGAVDAVRATISAAAPAVAFERLVVPCDGFVLDGVKDRLLPVKGLPLGVHGPLLLVIRCGGGSGTHRDVGAMTKTRRAVLA